MLAVAHRSRHANESGTRGTMGATILVVDDEDFIVDVVASVLEDEGHRVLRAYDGAAALGLIEREHPDLLLTDNLMPGLSGVELIARLHDRPDLAVPVILMSAITPVRMPLAVTFLPKPFAIAHLDALVVRLLA